jgi:hypothetical protein
MTEVNQKATEGETEALLKNNRESCSKEIGEALKKYNCFLTASMVIDVNGNRPVVNIINNELLNVDPSNPE